MAPIPKVALKDNESRTISYTMKRSGDDYHCSCPTWKISGRRISDRTCGHLKELLGDEYEEWRLGVGEGESDGGKKRKAVVDVEEEVVGEGSQTGEEEEEEEEVKLPVKRTRGKKVEVVVVAAARGRGRKPAAAAAAPAAAAKGRKKVKLSEDEAESGEGEVDGEEDEDEEEEDEDEDAAAAPAPKRTRLPRAAAANPPNPTAPLSAFTSNPLLAHKWDPASPTPITSWHYSEKLDGVRAIWTGTHFLSREGNPFHAPPWFTKRLPPNHVLDGELFTTRGGFQDCVSIVRAHNAPDRWKFSVTYQVFDCPSQGHLPFEQRLAFLADLITVKLRIKWVQLVAHAPVRDPAHVVQLLDEITAKGGEGLMLREPGSRYVHGRSRTLLKVKKFFDADAVVRGYNKGSGKNADVVGALVCEMVDAVTGKGTGRMFKVGSGLTDAQRRSPPGVGSRIVYKYQELSRGGNPRFPTFGGVRAD